MHRLQTKSHMLKDMHPDANNKFSAHTFNLLFSVIISLSYAYMRGNQVRYFSMNEYICLQKEVTINELTGICNECSVYKCNVLTYDFNWLTTNNKKDKCDECIPRLKLSQLCTITSWLMVIRVRQWCSTVRYAVQRFFYNATIQMLSKKWGFL